MEKQPTEKIILKVVLKRLKKDLKFNDNFLNNSKNNKLTKSQKIFLDDFGWYLENEISNIQYFKEYCYTIEKEIEKYSGFLDEITRIKLYEEYSSIISNTKKYEYKLINFIENYGFYINTDYSNIFRIYNFPDIILTSSNKAFEYYLANNGTSYFDGKLFYAGERKEADNIVKMNLEKFFNRNKNGLIKFN
jgi:hypothetical protein